MLSERIASTNEDDAYPKCLSQILDRCLCVSLVMVKKTKRKSTG